MKIEKLINTFIGTPANLDTNVQKVIRVGNKVQFITECKVTTCGRIIELEKEIARLKEQSELASAHLVNAGSMLVNGKVKSELRHAWKALNKEE